MTVTRAEAKLASGTLHYTALGEGRPLLYLHSAGGPIVSPFLQELAKTHRIFAPTAPGFDGTPVVDKVKGIPGLADFYAEFVQTVIGSACDVMGHSFGGWTALWFAIRHPKLVEQLVLEAPAGLRFGMSAGPPPEPAEIRRMLYAHPDKAAALMKPPEVGAANMQAFARYHENIQVDEELQARLPQIGGRTLIIMGTKEELIPAKAAYVMKEKIPASHLSYVYDAAHSVETDQPENMLRLVKAFLERGDAFIVNFGDAA